MKSSIDFSSPSRHPENISIVTVSKDKRFVLENYNYFEPLELEREIKQDSSISLLNRMFPHQIMVEYYVQHAPTYIKGRIGRNLLRELGFTLILREEIDKTCHWVVAVNRELNLRIAVNLKQRHVKVPIYLTIDTWLRPSRVYRGQADEAFLRRLIELRS